jgi:hypothetical protein
MSDGWNDCDIVAQEKGTDVSSSYDSTPRKARNARCTMLVGGLQSSKGERTMKVKGRDLLLMQRVISVSLG